MEKLVVQWADRYGLVDNPVARRRLTETHLGELIARCYPCLEADRLETLAGWFTWAFVIDDLYDRQVSPEVFGPSATTMWMLGALSFPSGHRAPEPQHPPLAAELAAVWQDLAARQSLAWQIRFIAHTGTFLDAFVSEARNRAHRRIPPLREYRQLRRVSGGIIPALDLLEYAAGLELAPLLHESQQLRTMLNKAADVVVWVNDVLSLPKELAVGEVTNGVLVVSREFGCDMAEAVDRVYEKVAEDVHTYLRAERDLMAMAEAWGGLSERDHAALTALNDGMKAWMRGNLEWGMGSRRYLAADGLRLTDNPKLLTPPAEPP
ncbi:hypothetical protein [Streptomyces sp. NPDC053048]|uniref:terpene synthase family protein n=1 Tax=Streptomyces sp. NPDC053048 TaxID=3365694 RepID=UPI0037D22EF2